MSNRRVAKLRFFFRRMMAGGRVWACGAITVGVGLA
jgi:hypothetical protein